MSQRLHTPLLSLVSDQSRLQVFVLVQNVEGQAKHPFRQPAANRGLTRHFLEVWRDFLFFFKGVGWEGE